MGNNQAPRPRGPYDYYFGEADAMTEEFYRNRDRPEYSGAGAEAEDSPENHNHRIIRQVISQEPTPIPTRPQAPFVMPPCNLPRRTGSHRGCVIHRPLPPPREIIDRLIALQDEEKEGLSEYHLSLLPTHKFTSSKEDKKCMVCQADYERGDTLITLPCAHKYHQACILTWLKDHKVCCICKREVKRS